MNVEALAADIKEHTSRLPLPKSARMHPATAHALKVAYPPSTGGLFLLNLDPYLSVPVYMDRDVPEGEIAWETTEGATA